ncbi:unnamed protein product [Closterium sp. NIES-53]
MDDKPCVLSDANASIPQLVVVVDTVLARAATEKVVREAGVWDSGMGRAVAVSGAMAAQELRWLTYLLTDLGEAPRSPPVQPLHAYTC